MNYQAIIVDDEQININIIKKLLENNFPQINIIGYANSVDELILLINEKEPDLLFLDINLKEQLVFEALDKINTKAQIIFVSSEQDHAVNAFRYDAVDFILKPIVKETFITAVVKVIRYLELRVLDPSELYAAKNSYSRYFSISSIEKQEIFKINEILYCSAEGRGTMFHLTEGRKIFSSRNLKEFSHLMNRNPLFIQISRHYIINFAHVRRIIKKGGPFCELLSGISIPISRRKLIEINKIIFSIE